MLVLVIVLVIVIDMARIVTSLTSLQFDRERLHVYQLGLKFAAFAIALVGNLSGDLRSIRDQLVRSSQSIPLNIAEETESGPPPNASVISRSPAA